MTAADFEFDFAPDAGFTVQPMSYATAHAASAQGGFSVRGHTANVVLPG